AHHDSKPSFVVHMSHSSWTLARYVRSKTSLALVARPAGSIGLGTGVSFGRGFARVAFLIERLAQAVEAGFPDAAVRRQPRFQAAERLRPERVEPPLLVRPHGNKSGFLENAQVPGHARLMNPGPGYEIAHRLLALAQHFHNPPPRRIRQRLEGI